MEKQITGKSMVLTRKMSLYQVSAVLDGVVNRVVKKKRVMFHRSLVTETKEYLVDNHMNKTPLTAIGKKRQTSRRCQPNYFQKQPILCRSQPIPLSVVWKIAEEIRQSEIKNKDKYYTESELPHTLPNDKKYDEV
jgi:hypothetical protein